MENLLELLIYIYKTHPCAEELSPPRLRYTVFLTDWKCAFDYGHQATDILWYNNGGGPQTNDIIQQIRGRTDIFNVELLESPYGGIVEKVKLRSAPRVRLDPKVKGAVDFVIKKTAHMFWGDFISLVFSTYPVRARGMNSYYNLTKDAIEYKQYLASQAVATS